MKLQICIQNRYTHWIGVRMKKESWLVPMIWQSSLPDSGLVSRTTRPTSLEGTSPTSEWLSSLMIIWAQYLVQMMLWLKFGIWPNLKKLQAWKDIKPLLLAFLCLRAPRIFFFLWVKTISWSNGISGQKM